jgi:hypothetical protein
MRDLPILTFCNKMDRESRDTFEIIDEIQENLAIDVTPASWPIGTGRDFVGAYDLLHDRLEIMDRADRNKVAESIQIRRGRPEAGRTYPGGLLAKFHEELEMARELLPAFDRRLPERLDDADLVRLGDQFLRRQGTDGRDRRIRAGTAAAESRRAPGRAGRDPGHRLCLQGPGQHGPQAPRPGGLCPAGQRPFRTRHEAASCAVEKADVDHQPGPVPGRRPRTGRRGLGRRHHRHPEPRAAAHRRRADRRRDPALYRHPQLCAGTPADPSARWTR